MSKTDPWSRWRWQPMPLLGAVILLPACAQCDRPVTTQPAAAGPATTSIASTPAESEWTPPQPKSASERRTDRLRMVQSQLAEPWDGRRPITNPSVLEAMRTVPRHVFVPEKMRGPAYQDTPLPIGYDQTISQPFIVAIMTELLHVTPASRILEIGTGSGYQAAVLGQITPHVYTIEIVKPLADRAGRTLREQGYRDVKVRFGDGYQGWPEAAPFDGIIVTCAAEALPEPLWGQLKPGGRIVIPTGSPDGAQYLTVITKTPEGKRKSERIFAVRFVPMTRELRE